MAGKEELGPGTSAVRVCENPRPPGSALFVMVGHWAFSPGHQRTAWPLSLGHPGGKTETQDSPDGHFSREQNGRSRGTKDRK